VIDPGQVSDPRGSAAVLAGAFVFFLVGCILLLASGASLSTVHAFAAFIVLAIVAAANQLIPVLGGAPPCAPRAVIATSLPLALGFAALIAAFAGAPLFVPAAVLLGGGALAWVAWSIRRLMQGTLEGRMRLVLGAAIASFALAASLGAAMAFAFGADSRRLLGLAPAHALLAIVAFASALVVAISLRLVPMFALAHTSPRRYDLVPAWAAIAVGVVGAASVAGGHRACLTAAFAVALVALAIGATTHVRTLRARLRRRLDVSLRFAIAAWCFAFGAALAALVASWRPACAGAAVSFAILGWLTLSIVGYGYKIAGFLAWQLAKARASAAPLPPLATAVPERPALAALALLSLGAAASGVTLVAAPQLVRAAFALYAAGGFCAVATLVRIPLLYGKGSSSCKTTPSSGSIPAVSIHPSR
jgi:hypothetical protein